MSQTAEHNAKFSLRKFMLLCVKSWKQFLISILLCGGLAYFFVSTKVPAYEVEAQLMLKNEGDASSLLTYGDLGRSFSMGDLFGLSSTTDNEVSVLKTHAVFLHTVKALALNSTCTEKRFGFKWVPMYTEAPLQLKSQNEMLPDTLSVALMFEVKKLSDNKVNVKVLKSKKQIAEFANLTLPATVDISYGKFDLTATEYFTKTQAKDFRISYTSYDAAAEAYGKVVKIICPDRKTDFIRLSIVTPDPKFGKLLLQSIIDNYNAIGNTQKDLTNSRSLDLVSDRLQSLKEELQTSDAVMEKFKKDNNLTDIQADAEFLLKKTGTLETSLLNAQIENEMLRMTSEFIKNPENNYSLIPDLLATPGASSSVATTSAMIDQYNKLILDRMNLSSSAKSNNVAITQLNDQIDAMRTNIIAAVDRAYTNSNVAIRDIRSETNKAQSKIGSIPALERRYIEMQRAFVLNEQMYQFLLQQKAQIEMSMSTTSYVSNTIDPPHVLSQPVGLSGAIILLLGLFVGFLLPCLWIYFRRMKTAPFVSVEELADLSDAPIVGALAKDSHVNDSLAVTSVDNVNARPFRKLRTDLTFILKEFDGKVIMVTSVNPEEGKTFVAGNLAVALALIGKRVLLIDADLHNPDLTKAFSFGKSSPSLSDFVFSPDEQELTVHHVDINSHASMDVLTSDPSDNYISDIIGSEKLVNAIEDIKKNYDYVVIDIASIRRHSDAYNWAHLSDMTLVVTKAKKTSPKDIEFINNLYNSGRLKRIALVANAVSKKEL